MGLCSSCESTSVATAKLILQDGRLQEFSYPVKVWYVLQKNPSCFICNSDEMDFDDAEEMAALAVKASSALTKSGGEKCGCRRHSFSPVLLTGEKGGRSSRRVADVCGTGLRSRGRSSAAGGGGGIRRNFEDRLNAIPE
ncbi:unnamed protein product [Ilex paraguariensis]|uniref:Uncharacterized protein n=1 Tax=Ilex paraguariensis TaxID=185542 RepID=A0ABC8TZL4_9AQUA